MKILGIDSSGLVASAAILKEDTIAAEFTVNNGKTHSQTLLPMIEQVVQMSGLDKRELDAVAVAAGPGSFTGLRIGSATAKGIAYVLQKPLIPVPTLEGLAYRLLYTDGVICPMLDARRNQVYAGLYERSGEELSVRVPGKAADIMEIIRDIKEAGKPVVFLGDGVPVHREILQKEFQTGCSFAPAHLNRQSAAAVAALGAVYFAKGEYEDAMSHHPVYFRKSQAERERAERLREGRV